MPGDPRSVVPGSNPFEIVELLQARAVRPSAMGMRRIIEAFVAEDCPANGAIPLFAVSIIWPLESIRSIWSLSFGSEIVVVTALGTFARVLLRSSAE